MAVTRRLLAVNRLTAFVLGALLAACTEATPVTTRTAGPSSQASTATSARQTTTSQQLPSSFVTSVTTDDLGWEIVDLPNGLGENAGVMAWTGHEIIIWGGDDSLSVPTGEPGLAYDPESRLWRVLPPGPKRATQGAAGVWTGSGLLICCGAHSPFQTVSYDPRTDAWTTLADAPQGGEYAKAVWTGETMLVVGPEGVVEYDPEADSWENLPPSPLPMGRLNEVAWTGADLVVWPANGERRAFLGMAFDTGTGSWRMLGEPPAWPAMLDIEWTGDDLIIWGGLPADLAGSSQRGVGSRLDWAEGHWFELPEPLPEPDGCECNLGSQELLWTGRELLVWTGFFSTGLDPGTPLLLAYRPVTGLWNLVETSSVEWDGQALMADDRVVIKGRDNLAISPHGWQSDGTPFDPAG